MRNYFTYSSQERKGLVLLFAIIIILQGFYFLFDFNSMQTISTTKQDWLSIQSKIDSIKDSESKYIRKVYPFNPNFISDYQGYKLGLSVLEINRILNHRKENRYVNSSKEFQGVTQISDSLLNVIAPYFKFPDWINRKSANTGYKHYENIAFSNKKKVVLIDINLATQEDLIRIYGIGEIISLRILNLKSSLGGFMSMEQMNDVWGLSSEVIGTLNSHFKVYDLPIVHKIDINNASLKEISQFYYFKYALAREIVTYRSMNGDIKNIEDLIKIRGFPIEKAKIIALYLDFD